MMNKMPSPSFVAEATRVEGNLTFYSEAYVYGTVEGNLVQQSLDKIHVGKNGLVEGSLSSLGPIVVEGKINGNLTSETKIKLLPSARVTGEMKAPSVEIRPGAYLDGMITMSLTKHSPRSKLAA